MKQLTKLIGLILFTTSLNSCDWDKPKEQYVAQDLNIALNNPNKFAWQIMLEVCKPFDSNNPNGELIWERWALASDIYKDPNTIPSWEELTEKPKDFSDFESIPLQQFLKLDSLETELPQRIEIKFQGQLEAQVEKLLFDPSVRLDSTSNETRMNKVGYKFIRDNDLYYTEGQEKFFNANKKIDLPIETREVKAQWREIKESQKDEYHFHIDTYKDDEGNEITKIWGLVAFHIITKDIPQWTWATFEHKNNPGLKEAENNPLLKSVDSYGKDENGNISKALLNDFKKEKFPKKWENYILRGTQTDFTTLTGVPTILANTYIEEGFTETSSCISCHSKATIGKRLAFSELPVDIQEKINNGDERASHYDDRLPIFASRSPLLGDVGTPNPDWFETKSDTITELKYLQTDFMWSFFRSKRRNPYKPE